MHEKAIQKTREKKLREMLKQDGNDVDELEYYLPENTITTDENEDEQVSIPDKSSNTSKKRRLSELGDENIDDGNAKHKKLRTARDLEFYISSVPKNLDTEKGLEINPITNKSTELELIPDEKDEFMKKKQSKKWDRKKMKFVTVEPTATTVQTLLKGERKAKNESGQAVKKKHSTGHMYQEWKEKTKMYIPKEGEMEDTLQVKRLTSRRFIMRNGRRIAISKEPEESSKDKKVRNELKTKEQIQRVRKIKDKQKARQQNKKSKEKRDPTKPRPTKKKGFTPSRSKMLIRKRK